MVGGVIDPKYLTPEAVRAFGKRLDKAAYWEAHVAGFLARQGFYVLHSPINQDPKFDLSTVDLLVYDRHPTNAVEPRIVELEVKGCQEHSKEDFVFVCSRTSFGRKYGKLCMALPVPYIMVDRDGRMLHFPRGTAVEERQHWDVGRNEIFTAVKASKLDRRPIEQLIQWLRAKKPPQV